MSRIRHLVVTGIPRSGTTFTAAFVDGLDDAVCLSEPDRQDARPREMNDRGEYSASATAACAMD